MTLNAWLSEWEAEQLGECPYYSDASSSLNIRSSLTKDNKLLSCNIISKKYNKKECKSECNLTKKQQRQNGLHLGQ
jgi:hypothetical protein